MKAIKKGNWCNSCMWYTDFGNVVSPDEFYKLYLEDAKAWHDKLQGQHVCGFLTTLFQWNDDILSEARKKLPRTVQGSFCEYYFGKTEYFKNVAKSNEEKAMEELCRSIDIQKELRAIQSNNIKRKNAAVYRLYKNHSLSPKVIMKLTHISENRIKIIIGNTFSKLCKSDEQCIFKDVLVRSK